MVGEMTLGNVEEHPSRAGRDFFLDLDDGLGLAELVAQVLGLALELGDPSACGSRGVAGRPRLCGARAASTAASRSRRHLVQMGRVQALLAQQRPDLAGLGAAVGPLQNGPFIRRGERPTLGLRRDFGIGPDGARGGAAGVDDLTTPVALRAPSVATQLNAICFPYPRSRSPNGRDNRREVVGISETSAGDHAFLWTEQGGMQDLNGLLTSRFGFVLTHAVAISAQAPSLRSASTKPPARNSGTIMTTMSFRFGSSAWFRRASSCRTDLRSSGSPSPS